MGVSQPSLFDGPEQLSILDQLDERKSGLVFERGFWRHPHTGAAMLNGRQYGSPSGAWKNHGENTYNLQKWSERMLVAGMIDLILDADLTELDLLDYHTADPNGEHRERFDGLARQALDKAKANLAADRGTVGHLITELADQGAWIEAIAEGEELGLGPQLQEAIVQVWNELLATHELEVVAIEQTVVCDRLNLAGTLDRIAKTGRPLTFTRSDGSHVTIPKGVTLVLDVKTGGLKLGRNGQPRYWDGYALQVLAYAEAVPVDVDPVDPKKFERQEWDEPISTDHALIAHLDLAGALDTGTLTARLFYVDLVEAQVMADAMHSVKYARKANYFGVGGDVVVTDVDTPSRVRSWIQGRVDVIGFDLTARKSLSRLWPRDLTSVAELPDSRIDEVVGLLDRVEAEHQIPFGEPDPRQLTVVGSTSKQEK